jgi:hypothetical protein
MPRYKGKSRYYKKKHQNGNDSSYRGGGALSPSDRAALRTYLVDYKHGCERTCFPLDHCPSDEETVVTAPADHAKSQQDQHAIQICSSYFPVLTDEVFSRPFLALPENLSGKQRRAVHEICVDGK